MVDVYSMYFTTNSNKTFQLLLVNSTAANNNTQYIYCTTASVAIIYNHSIIIVWSILITFIQVYIVLHKECAIVPTAWTDGSQSDKTCVLLLATVCYVCLLSKAHKAHFMHVNVALATAYTAKMCKNTVLTKTTSSNV